MTLDQGHDLTSDYRQPLHVAVPRLSYCKSYRPDDDVTTESTSVKTL